MSKQPLHLWSRREVQEFLGIAEVTLDRLIARREIGSFRVGRRRMFSPADVKAYLESRYDRKTEK